MVHKCKIWFIYKIQNIIFMIINNIAKKTLIRGLTNSLMHSYGELVYTNRITHQNSFDKIPTYRLIDLDGKLLDTNHKYDTEKLVKILKTMIFVDQMDTLLLKVKSQGKISFYMSSFGEHACIVGSAAALEAEDYMYSQYREQGAHVWRGATIESMINQCLGNSADLGKGRQMPIHYGSKALNNVTISSNLTSQVPQASGTGYAFRTANQKKVCACYCGEGAASMGDFPTALNFAATLRSQTLFLVRNNKYAISTPVADQYVADGVAPRAVSFGIATARVDGNDALAVLHATQQARKYILEHKKPYFMEFMTYRVGDHSTSDNSAMYRHEDERKEWKDKNDPIKRLVKFLSNIGYKDIPDEAAERTAVRKQITEALHKSYKHKFPSILSLFDDVYDKLPQHLQEQKDELKAHIEAYGHKYDYLDKHLQE